MILSLGFLWRLQTNAIPGKPVLANHNNEVRETLIEAVFNFYPGRERIIIMGFVSRYFWAGILLASLVAPSTQAGGLYLYELGNSDVGAAAAG